jgi:hypothetical protein
MYYDLERHHVVKPNLPVASLLCAVFVSLILLWGWPLQQDAAVFHTGMNAQATGTNVPGYQAALTAMKYQPFGLRSRVGPLNANDDEQYNYGESWYEATKKRRSDAEELARRREANFRANNGKERKDLYTDNWDGDVYKGSSFNILTVLIGIAVGVPVAGLIFAYTSYGVYWG